VEVEGRWLDPLVIQKGKTAAIWQCPLRQVKPGMFHLCPL
jgi:hypothetical protein